MGKKRLTEIIRGRNKRAQVTIFIIIGILLLFGFIFVIQVFSGVQKDQLNNAQDTILMNSFKKEGMRIYVEDCLQDELEQGLLLLGTQGRIWGDQPGGSKPFTDKTGIVFDGNKIYYGISNREYFNYPNAYPCTGDTSLSPQFCEYTHPDIQTGFGDLKLRKSTLEQDLKAYLINRTITCVENFTHNNISKSAKIESTQLQLNLAIENDGISVSAEYPLKFKIGSNEFFELTKFDFFYPSKFKLLLDAAVAYPLERDYRFLDFNYAQDYLSSPAFTAYDSYRSLGIKMIKNSLSNGDDVFTFTPNLYTILNSPTEYYFRLARQNRPPALDYIQRYGCPTSGYDYLVILGDSELGNINITSFAWDPDEDSVNTTFLEPKEMYPLEPNAQDKWYVGSAMIREGKDLIQGTWNILFNATDQHKLSDWQEVRILVDRPIVTNLSLSLPYNDIPAGYGDLYFASAEDPVFVNITYPAESLAKFSATINLNYTNKEGSEDFSFPFETKAGITSKCLSFPWDKENNKCSLEDYKNQNLALWPAPLSGNYAHFNTPTNEGFLNLTFSIQYCGGELNKSSSSSARVIVKTCLPHHNPERPFPYPYQNYLLKNGIFTQDANINPLEATHACCLGSVDNPSGWRIAPQSENVTCFVNPKIGCYGKSEVSQKAPQYLLLLEQEGRYCDGVHGNTCTGDMDYTLVNNTMICGIHSLDSQCNSNIPSQCQGKPAFSFINDQGNKGWCHGLFGCSKITLITSDAPLVYTKTDTRVLTTSSIIKAFIESGDLDDTSSPKKFYLHQGCTPNDITANSYCDSTGDGRFWGHCTISGCVNDI
jgi:hypothetical protein